MSTPSATPLVTHQDKLWTQIDVLDDVRELLDQLQSGGSFPASAAVNQQLERLAAAQKALLADMETHVERILADGVVEADEAGWSSVWETEDLDETKKRLFAPVSDERMRELKRAFVMVSDGTEAVNRAMDDGEESGA